MVDIFTKEKRSWIMSRIRSRNTKPELRFMETHGVRAYQPKLPHHPDFILEDGTVVYLDSPFWHCWLPAERYERLPEYWREKLFKNLVRDLCADAFWFVVRRTANVPFERIPTPSPTRSG